MICINANSLFPFPSRRSILPSDGGRVMSTNQSFHSFSWFLGPRPWYESIVSEWEVVPTLVTVEVVSIRRWSVFSWPHVLPIYLDVRKHMHSIRRAAKPSFHIPLLCCLRLWTFRVISQPFFLEKTGKGVGWFLRLRGHVLDMAKTLCLIPRLVAAFFFPRARREGAQH